MKDDNARIFVVCPEISTPCGGVKQHYRHVDVLNRAGFSAFILHWSKGFRADFFENKTRVAYSCKMGELLQKPEKLSIKQQSRRALNSVIRFFFNTNYRTRFFKNLWHAWTIRDMEIKPWDIVVFPEIYAFNSLNTGPFRKVIFNQGAYLTFPEWTSFSGDLKIPYSNKNALATITVSEHNANHLRVTFPDHCFYRVHNGIPSELFHYAGNKKKQIAFMPRKNRNDINQLLGILKIRGKCNDFRFVEIENMCENEVAQTLKKSLIFLSFSHREGGPLPPMEAMACGCIVIGYDGSSGKEYFKRKHCYPIDDGDLISFAETVETVVGEFRTHEERLIEMGKKASEFILSEYSTEREEREIVQFWRQIFRLSHYEKFHESVTTSAQSQSSDKNSIDLIKSIADRQPKERDFIE